MNKHDAPSSPVLRSTEDGIARFVLNRPAKKNAISNAMLDALAQGLADAVADPQVRCIVLSGAGECFTSGRDTSEFGAPASLVDGSLAQAQAGFLTVLSILADAPKPTIASVHGFALGGGQAISLACDFLVAERDARFGNVEMAYGFPAAMNLVLLARHLGRRMGLEIAMTGETYSAERYFQLGLVNRLAEPGGLADATADFARLLASRAPWAVARTKQSFRTAEDLSMADGLRLGDQLNQLLMLSSQTNPVHSRDADTRAGLAASMKGADDA